MLELSVYYSLMSGDWLSKWCSISLYLISALPCLLAYVASHEEYVLIFCFFVWNVFFFFLSAFKICSLYVVYSNLNMMSRFTFVLLFVVVSVFILFRVL